jgi:dihydroorotate dehydrogenase
MLYSLARPLLFTLEPEQAHALTLRGLQVLGDLPGQAPARGTPVELMGLRFANRVGLAAGFDKNAEAVDGLGRLGFGFVEVGTVTPRPQPGNPQPRVFRYPEANALVNRMGFPNEGVDACVARLRTRSWRGIVGVNIGKNADTPIERAADDYLLCLRAVRDVADYVTVNISSPNTASLRELHQPARLAPLLEALLTERDLLVAGSGRRLPLVLKLSPDLDEGALDDVAMVLRQWPVDAVAATNTTITRDALPAARDVTGGLSGRPLHSRSLAIVAALRARLGPAFPLIGMGGIDSAAAALAMRAAGADLVQCYTGLVFRGPALVRDCVRALG